MKVAFTSCFDAVDAPQQPVWTAIAAHKPQVLLLLGDSIYMDYGLRLRWPQTYKPATFARKMHARYAAQWAVPGWLALLRSVEVCAATWDDHDYAWEGSHGAGDSSDRVDDARHRVSRALLRQFTECLNTRPTAYPACPPLAQLLQEPLAGIQHAFVHNGVQFLMADARSYRDPMPRNWQDLQTATLLGTAQRQWLIDRHQAHAGLSVLASSSTLTDSGDAWENWRGDQTWLRDQWAPRRLVVVSGDIHDNRYRKHTTAAGPLHEFTASGAARPKWGGVEGNFGLMSIDGLRVDTRWFGPSACSPVSVQL